MRVRDNDRAAMKGCCGLSRSRFSKDQIVAIGEEGLHAGSGDPDDAMPEDGTQKGTDPPPSAERQAEG